MSHISQEVAEICESILIFQKHIIEFKDNLFLYPNVSDQLIWNHIVGEKIESVTPQLIGQFLNSNKATFKQSNLSLLFFEYSTLRQKKLTKKQFLSIFIDLRRKFIDQVIAHRNSKYSYAKNHTPHYKITEILVIIMTKTLDFLELKEKMKENIFLRRRDQNFNIQKVSPEHFLVFLNPHHPTWLIQQSSIVLEHIMKFRNRNLKQFYYFFVPFSCKSKKLNPDKKILKKFNPQKDLKQTYSSVIDHRKASHFGNKSSNLKKTLYLK